MRGFAAGWLAYMVVFVVSAYDGLPSIVMQPVIAAVVATIFALAAELAGRPLRSSRLWASWERLGRWTLLLAALGLSLLLFSAPLGLSQTYDPQVPGERSFDVMPLRWLLTSYFLCVFPFVNLPRSDASAR